MGAAAAITAVGTGVQLLGQRQAGKAQEQQFNYSQQVAENNRGIADKLAVDAIERGETAEKAHRRGVGTFKGKQRAALAATGVVVDQDTALDILLDTAEFGEIDALTIRNSASREAFGFRAQGEGFAAQAAISGAQAAGASRATNIQNVTTILGGARDFFKDTQ